MIKVGINGFGRIGRVCMRILLASDDFEVVAINDPVSTDNLCYLLNFDSHYGRICSEALCTQRHPDLHQRSCRIIPPCYFC